MSTTRANIINALHALESGKPAAEVTAWLKDAIVDLTPPTESQERKPAIEGYIVTQEGPAVWVVRYPDGDEFARCVQFTNYIVVHLRDRPPVHVRTLDAAIDYIKLVINLNKLLDAKSV